MTNLKCHYFTRQTTHSLKIYTTPTVNTEQPIQVLYQNLSFILSIITYLHICCTEDQY